MIIPTHRSCFHFEFFAIAVKLVQYVVAFSIQYLHPRTVYHTQKSCFRNFNPINFSRRTYCITVTILEMANKSLIMGENIQKLELSNGLKSMLF